MANKPDLMPCELKDGSGWCVAVTWPNGSEEQVNGFRSELAAADWIKRESAAWLQKHPMSRHASHSREMLRAERKAIRRHCHIK
jgi:hypothetical protein